MALSEWWHYRDVPRVELPDPFVLDIATGRLGGARLGDPTDVLLARFGAPSSYEQATRRGLWFYPQWGLKVEVDKGRIGSFAAAIDLECALAFDPVRERLASFTGTVVLEEAGRPLAAPRVTPPDVRRLFGEPTDDEVDEDDGELYLTFEEGGRLRLFIFVQRGGQLRLGQAEVGMP